jgi:hypothetical protein
MQIWVPFFEEASSRPLAPPAPREALATRDGLLSLTPSNHSTPVGDGGDPFTTPLTGSVPNQFPFSTPDSTPAGVNNLPAYSQHPTPYPDRGAVDDTLEDEATSDGGEVHVPGEDIAGETSPLPPTPSMLSPPRSCFVLKNRDSNASSSSFIITPSSASPRTPVSFQRGPLSALGHNQAAGNQRNELPQQGLLGKGDGRTRGAMSDEFGEQENQGPVREEVNFGPERLPGEKASQSYTHSMGCRFFGNNHLLGSWMWYKVVTRIWKKRLYMERLPSKKEIHTSGQKRWTRECPENERAANCIEGTIVAPLYKTGIEEPPRIGSALHYKVI